MKTITKWMDVWCLTINNVEYDSHLGIKNPDSSSGSNIQLIPAIFIAEDFFFIKSMGGIKNPDLSSGFPIDRSSTNLIVTEDFLLIKRCGPVVVTVTALGRQPRDVGSIPIRSIHLAIKEAETMETNETPVIQTKRAELKQSMIDALEISKEIEASYPGVRYNQESVSTWGQTLFNELGRDKRTKEIEQSKQRNGNGGNRFSRSSYTPRPGGYPAGTPASNGNGNGHANGNGNGGVAVAPRQFQVGVGPATEKQLNALLRFVSNDASKSGKTPEAYLEEFLGKPLAEVSKQEASVAFDQLKG